ncbi:MULTISPECIES: hypothetical protein [unclassified Fibrobacter]|uniref:hypothetical protein n=1 Tax=unclassified Fibrobacter TaxID=2634177 RepID=UPI000D6B498B|nr:MULTISPECIES: hypothetical protein [unclassified Fibrobacter]PWJ61042.1 hypothetical protein BGX12_13118 [Fibrobacter sp. UWR4]PZW68063.1 hypothetical protein C8E88_102139 [Fibrobacter sp. UWR1]
MFKSLLSNDFLLELQKQLSMINKLCNEKTRSLKKAPEGYLRVMQQGKNKIPRFYHVLEKYSNGVYLNKKHLADVKKLAQKEYDETLLTSLRTIQKLMHPLVKAVEKTHLDEISNKIPSLRKRMITPFRPDKKTFTEDWLSKDYTRKTFLDGDFEYFANCGLRVRSKSEAFIADTLDQLKIPFRYECPHTINGITIYPDFTCLNIRTGEEIVWEHFGMLDRDSYAEKTVRKMYYYLNDGYVLGRNLIISLETGKQPLSPIQAKQIAKEYLL